MSNLHKKMNADEIIRSRYNPKDKILRLSNNEIT